MSLCFFTYAKAPTQLLSAKRIQLSLVKKITLIIIKL